MKQLKNLKKNKQFLKNFKSRYDQCKKTDELVRELTGGQVNCLCEIIKNLCLGNIQLKRDTVNKFRPYEKTLNSLKTKKLSMKKRKNILRQKGNGFILPLLLSLIVPHVVNFIEKQLE